MYVHRLWNGVKPRARPSL